MSLMLLTIILVLINDQTKDLLTFYSLIVLVSTFSWLS